MIRTILVLALVPAAWVRPDEALAQQATRHTTQQPAAQLATAPAGYKLSSGPCEVETVQRLVLHDEARGKDLEVVVRYPRRVDAKGSYAKLPLVIFSHGMGGSGPITFPELTAHWASHGYVVVLPTHTDSIRLRREKGQQIKDPRKEPLGALSTVDPVDRVADVKFILDSIGTLEQRVPGLSADDGKGGRIGLIDRGRLAVAGHSAGAFTAQLAIGVKARGARITGQRGLAARSVADDRLRCALIISGQGTTNRAFTESSWSELTKPILVIGGSKDVSGVGNETPESRRHSYEYSRGRGKGGPAAYLLYIDGATHGSYQGKALANLLGEEPTTPLKTITDATAASTLAFLDAWVKDDPDAKKALESDAIRRIAPDKVRWEWK